GLGRAQGLIDDGGNHGQRILYTMAEFTVKKPRLTLRLHRGCRFDNGIDQPPEDTVFIADRAVAEGKIALFRIAVTIDHEREVLDECRFASVGASSDRTYLMPSFAPDVAKRSSQCR